MRAENMEVVSKGAGIAGLLAYTAGRMLDPNRLTNIHEGYIPSKPVQRLYWSSVVLASSGLAGLVVAEKMAEKQGEPVVIPDRAHSLAAERGSNGEPRRIW